MNKPIQYSTARTTEVMPTTRLRFQNGRFLYDGFRAYGLSLYMGNEFRELDPDPQTRSSRSRWGFAKPGMFRGMAKAIAKSLVVDLGGSSRRFGLGSGEGALKALLLRWRLKGSRIMGSVGAYRDSWVRRLASRDVVESGSDGRLSRCVAPLRLEGGGWIARTKTLQWGRIDFGRKQEQTTQRRTERQMLQPRHLHETDFTSLRQPGIH